MKKKVLVLGNSCLVIFGMRGELIQRLVSEGYEVTAVAPSDSFGNLETYSKAYGCSFENIVIDRHGTNIFKEFMLLLNYIKIMKRVRPDAVLTYTIKCNIYGGLASRILKIPYYVNITGRGKGLEDGGIQEKILRVLYKMALKSAGCVYFQNENDRQYFLNHHIRFPKGVLLPGSGVNLEKYMPLPYPSDDKIVFTFVARVMKAKGIDQFLDAAEAIRKEKNNVEFHVCGYLEEDYKEVIENAQSSGTIVYHGLVSDIRTIEKISQCIVLPTYYPEGLSNVLLEAAACARPIITTNHPGCREVVDDGVNGYLVRERDSEDLIRAMRKFLSLPREERRNMGLAGREKVEKEFDRQIVVQKYVKELESLEHTTEDADVTR